MELDSLSMIADTLSVVTDSSLKFVQYSPQAREISVGMFGNPELANSLGGMIIATIALLGIFFVPFIAIVSIVWFILKHKRNENQLKASLVIKAIEHGQTIPDNLFETKEKEKKSPLQKGIIWTSVGLGIVLFFVIIGFTKDKDAFAGMAIGAIPTFVGIGYLLFHCLDKKQAKENDGDK